MARRGRRNSQRDAFDIATPVLERRNALTSVDDLLRAYEALDTTPLEDLDDGRRWHPLGDDRPARGFRPNQAAFSNRVVLFNDREPSRQFRDPSGVATCIRRKTRREVLHALRKTGKGGSKRRRYTWKSFVKC